ncbi:hypothetical protein AB0D59_31365 [Streptomyces sp. NPDC048417]|uniref:hypothetical protein n=1 Tax=Streptomyces sp. NPDC048417 TaxID=3155387 RepID=UPI0034480A47
MLLVFAHLAGAVHGPAFTGPQWALPIASCARAECHTDDGAGHPPERDHRADGHIDHAADRPRAVADDTVADPGQGGADATPAPSAAAGTARTVLWPRPTRHPAAAHHGRALAFHCVWRL